MLTIAACIAILWVLWGLRSRRNPESGGKNATAAAHLRAPLVVQPASVKVVLPGGPGPHDEAERRFYCAALGMENEMSALTAADRTLLDACRLSAMSAIEQRQYFPRRPLLMPQLMRAVNDDSKTPRSLACIILQDPVLAGDVLNVANSYCYRSTPVPVETIDRALMLLGIDGLKKVVARCVLHPVIRSAEAGGDYYSSVVWARALDTATAASVHAAETDSCDRYRAHLLGLLSALGPLMLYRYARDTCRRRGGRPPSAAALHALVQESSRLMTVRIAEHWRLSRPFQQAMVEQTGIGGHDMSTLGRALWYGERVATYAALAREHPAQEGAARAAMLQAGLDERLFDAMWHSLQSSADGVVSPDPTLAAQPAALP